MAIENMRKALDDFQHIELIEIWGFLLKFGSIMAIENRRKALDDF